MMSPEPSQKPSLRWEDILFIHDMFLSSLRRNSQDAHTVHCSSHSRKLILFSIIQEFSEYVSLAPSFTTDSFLHNINQPHSLIHAGQVSPRSGIISRELSPVERYASARVTQGAQSTLPELDSVDKDQYYQKVREEEDAFIH
mgnify:FL=1